MLLGVDEVELVELLEAELVDGVYIKLTCIANKYDYQIPILSFITVFLSIVV